MNKYKDFFKTRGAQVLAVVAWYDIHHPRQYSASPVIHQPITDPESVNCYLNVQSLAVHMFVMGHVNDFRYDIIRAYLIDMQNNTFRKNDPALNL